jgi:hypothetical protein
MSVNSSSSFSFERENSQTHHNLPNISLDCADVVPIHKISRETDEDHHHYLIPYSYRLDGWYFSLFRENEKCSHVLSYDTREIISLFITESNNCRVIIQFCLDYCLELQTNSADEARKILNALEQLQLNYRVEQSISETTSQVNTSHLFVGLLKLEVFDQV